MATLYLCGAGNSEGVRLALTINSRRKRWDEMYILDDDISKHGKSILGIRIIGSFSTLESVDPLSSEVVNLVARGTDKRLSARRKIEMYGLPFAEMIHPDVDLSGVELAKDVIVYQNAVLGPETVIEEGSVVFIGSVVGHESHVGKHCVIAPNAILNARVILGAGVYVGSNATILPEISVGADATIGVGSAVVQNVAAGTTVMGVPAEMICTKSGNGKMPVASFSRIERENNRTDYPSNDTYSNTFAHNKNEFDDYTAPRNETEETISSIWQQIFNIGRIGLDDNFFTLGGSSLQAMKMIASVQETFKIELSMADLLRTPTIMGLSERVLRIQIDRCGEDQIGTALMYLERLSDEDIDRMLDNL